MDQTTPVTWNPSSLDVARAALARRLPDRYDDHQRKVFDRYVTQVLRPGATILDVGAGRAPTWPPNRRPAGCTYVGLDLSATELEQAELGAYDETVTSDVTSFVPTWRDGSTRSSAGRCSST